MHYTGVTHEDRTKHAGIILAKCALLQEIMGVNNPTRKDIIKKEPVLTWSRLTNSTNFTTLSAK